MMKEWLVVRWKNVDGDTAAKFHMHRAMAMTPHSAMNQAFRPPQWGHWEDCHKSAAEALVVGEARQAVWFHAVDNG